MKALSTLFLFISISYFTFGQSTIEWEHVLAPDSTLREIVYVSKKGTLIARDIQVNDFFVSFDSGVTWEKKFSNSPNIIQNSAVSAIFKEDAKSNIYLANYEEGNFYKPTIYFIDNISHNVVKWHQFDEKVEDFNFMENGDFIYSTTSSLKLVDVNNFDIKKEVALNTHHAEIYLSEGYKNYLGTGFGASNELQEFDNNLNFIGQKFSADFSVLYSKGFFFTKYDGTYSKDGGKTWTKLPIDFYDIFIGQDGTVFGNSIDWFYSNDNGESFKILGGLKTGRYISSDANGNIFINENSCPSSSSISSDKGKNWQTLNKIGQDLPMASSIVAGLNQSLISKVCLYYQAFKTKSSTQWEDFINLPLLSDELINLPSGEFISTDFPITRISNDFKKFTNLPFYLSLPFFNQSMFVKKDKLFFVGYDTIYISKDFSTIENKYPLKQTFYDFGIPTPNDKLIFLDFSAWAIYDYKNKTTIDLLFENEPLNCSYMESSYNGQNVYGVSYDYISSNKYGIYFYKSIDEGHSFSKNLITFIDNDYSHISIKVDHLENIYLINEKTILFSSDQGTSWKDITPTDPNLRKLTGLSISYDNYIYLSTIGLGIVKSKFPLKDPKAITVKVRNDVNKNCKAENSETNPIFGSITLENGYTKLLDNNGEVILPTYKSQQKFSLNLNGKINQQCNDNYTVRIDTITNTGSITIPVKTTQECADLKVGISAALLRRCFSNTYSGYIKNEGNVTSENTSITLTLDEFFEFESTTLQVVSYNHPLLVLNVPNIPANESIYYNLMVKVKCEAELGQEHCIKAKVYASNICADPERNDYTECQKNRGSFDPNDKAIYVDGKKDAQYTSGSDKVEYTIRFQNTGTDTAFTVRIEDDIASEFDIQSLRPIAASHNFSYEIKRGRNLVVTFNKINLVDSFTNEPLSHGFIKFEIKLDTSAKLNDKLINQAEIYFDFNEPVITNKVETINGFPTKTNEVKIDQYVYAVPNPATTEFNVKGNLPSNQDCTINVFDINGRLISNQKSNTSNIKINSVDFSSGQYIVKIITKDNYYFCKVVKM